MIVIPEDSRCLMKAYFRFYKCWAYDAFQILGYSDGSCGRGRLLDGSKIGANMNEVKLRWKGDNRSILGKGMEERRCEKYGNSCKGSSGEGKERRDLFL